MWVVLWSNCRPGCIQFTPAAWPCLAVEWNETSHVVISTFSGLLWKVIWTPIGVAIGFVGHGTEPCLLQIFQAQSKTVLWAQLCHASRNAWILTLEYFIFGLSGLSGANDQSWSAAAVPASSPVRVQLLRASHLVTGLSFYSTTSLAKLTLTLNSVNLGFLAF